MLRMKRCVANTSGLTLIETLMALFTFAFMVTLIPTLISFFNEEETFFNYDYDMFVVDISEEYKNSDGVFSNRNQSAINFMTERGIISYRASNDRIVKSVDGAGFITLLFGVTAFIVEEENGMVSLRVHYENGGKSDVFYFRK